MHRRANSTASFVEKKSLLKVRKGQSFIIEGSPMHGLYFVHTGKVKVFNTGINGREQILRFSTDGEVIGQRGFSKDHFYPISAVAMEDSMLCHFSTSLIEGALKTLPKLSYDFMTFYAEELHRSETKVRMFAHMTVREKVIDALLYINRKFGQLHGFLNIALSRRDIADFAGTTEEQVIRTISALKKDELLQTSGKKIGIVDVELLGKEIDDHHFFIQS